MTIESAKKRLRERIEKAQAKLIDMEPTDIWYRIEGYYQALWIMEEEDDTKPVIELLAPIIDRMTEIGRELMEAGGLCVTNTISVKPEGISDTLRSKVERLLKVTEDDTKTQPPLPDYLTISGSTRADIVQRVNRLIDIVANLKESS